MLNKKPQTGFALIEAMVAILVMALGILGILGVQMRTLSDTQTGVRRAQAIRAIEDLSERMKVNPSALDNINSYVSGWNAAASPAACKATPCTASALAAADIAQWKVSVKNSLPLSDANVFLVADEAAPDNHRQLGVMISWRENERSDGSAAENTAYRLPLVVASGGANVTCPADRICHLQYIQLTSRCSVYTMAGGATNQFMCPS